MSQGERKFCGDQIKRWMAAKIIPRVPHCYCFTKGKKNVALLPLLNGCVCARARAGVEVRSQGMKKKRDGRSGGKKETWMDEGAFFSLFAPWRRNEKNKMW